MNLPDEYILATAENICGIRVELAMESQLIKILIALEIHEKRTNKRVATKS